MNRRRWIAAAAGVTILAGGVVGLAAGQGSTEREPETAQGLLAASAERLSDPADFHRSEGAIAFPAGMGYADAVRALHVAQTSGRPDPRMEATAALPDGVVAVIPRGSAGRVVIDLAAPYGYDVRMKVALAPTYTSDEEPTGNARTSALGPWYPGWSLVVPGLPDCMVVSAVGEEPARTCGSEDRVTAAGVVPLP